MVNETRRRRQRRNWTDAEKRQIVAQAARIGNTTEAAEKLDVLPEVLRRWRRQFAATPTVPEPAPYGTDPLEAARRRVEVLERENARLRHLIKTLLDSPEPLA